MGSQKSYRVIFIIVLVLLATTAGRLVAQEDNPPIPTGGALGAPPTEPIKATVGAPPQEVPDSTPVIDHPPEEPNTTASEPVALVGSPSEEAIGSPLVIDQLIEVPNVLPTEVAIEVVQQTAVREVDINTNINVLKTKAVKLVQLSINRVAIIR